MAQTSKKQKREEIKEELEKAKKKSNQTDLLLKAVVGFVILIFVAGFIWLIINSKKQAATSTKELGVVTCVDKACVRDHIDPGAAHAPYNSNPPSNGPHYASPAQCKIYDNEVVDETAIHALEHGAVWITYKDKNDSSLRDELTQVVKDEGSSKIILSPRAKDDSVVGISSWGRVLKLDSFDKQKIEDYIKLYRDGPATPEPLAGC